MNILFIISKVFELVAYRIQKFHTRILFVSKSDYYIFFNKDMAQSGHLILKTKLKKKTT